MEEAHEWTTIGAHDGLETHSSVALVVEEVHRQLPMTRVVCAKYGYSQHL